MSGKKIRFDTSTFSAYFVYTIIGYIFLCFKFFKVVIFNTLYTFESLFYWFISGSILLFFKICDLIFVYQTYFLKNYQVTTIYLAFQCCIDMHIYRNSSIPELESVLNKYYLLRMSGFLSIDTQNLY